MKKETAKKILTIIQSKNDKITKRQQIKTLNLTKEEMEYFILALCK